MGTYKVLQDIEAEDKLLGPLSLRQFVYAIIVLVSGFISFKLITSNLWYVSLPLLPVMAFFGMLSAPFGHDQSNEVWLLAKTRFALKPRKRLWDQSGIQELVTITVPKKVEKHLTKEFDKYEAKSRLEALANTIDSRGWAVKNIDVSTFQQPLMAPQASSDRLVEVGQIAQPVADHPDEFDVLDHYDNPTVGNVDKLIDDSERTRQQQIANLMKSNTATSTDTSVNANAPAQQGWCTNQPAQVAPATPPVTTQHTGTIASAPSAPANTTFQIAQPGVQLQTQQPTTPATKSDQTNRDVSTSTKSVNPDIINLANNDDLDVATIARQADKAVEQSDDGNEVVISLH